jgi:hypothetical protein
MARIAEQTDREQGRRAPLTDVDAERPIRSEADLEWHTLDALMWWGRAEEGSSFSCATV